MEEFKAFQLCKDANDLLLMATKGAKLKRMELTDVRDYVIAQIMLLTATRPGALEKARIS